MPCNCGFELDIRACPPYANQKDVIAALQGLFDNCCYAELTTPCLDPVSDLVTAMTEAFPNGIIECACDAIYIKATNDIYYASFDGGTTFIALNNSCHGILTTVALNPTNSPAAAYAEAFPCDISHLCDVIYITAEDGSLFFSTDGGTTFSQVSTTVSNINQAPIEFYGAYFDGNTGWVWTNNNITTLNDTTGYASIVANKIRLATGVYEIVTMYFAHNIGNSNANSGAGMRLRNQSTSTTIASYELRGTSSMGGTSNPSTGVLWVSFGDGIRFTVTDASHNYGIEFNTNSGVDMIPQYNTSDVQRVIIRRVS